VKSLCEFTADLLSQSGALVENIADDLEALLPDHAARVLELPEHARLTFSAEGTEGALVSYDSELFKKMGALLGARGQFSVVTLPASPIRFEKLGERLSEKVLLQNAVFDLERTSEESLSYLLTCFRYTARSDERQEGIGALLINERNLSVRPFDLEQLDLLEDGTEGSMEGSRQPASDAALKALGRAQAERARDSLSDFIKSLERRLNRDIARVRQYYQTLAEEAMRIAAKKAAGGEDRDKAQRKIEAIETERTWKIQDLIAKYRLTLQTEPIALVRIETKAPIFWLALKRRKGRRSFPLTYNPLVKALDPFPCEGCFYPKKAPFVCDDRLHLVCPACFAACPQCGKEICRACRPRGCPTCKPEPERGRG
jgi:hypothetical protein